MQRLLTRFWPGHHGEPLIWTLGDWSREHLDFRVLELAPVDREHWIYVSADAAHLRSLGAT